VGLGLLTGEVSRSYSDTQQSVELLLTSDRSVAEASNKKHTQETVIHVTGDNRTRNPETSKRPQNRDIDRAATGIGTLHSAKTVTLVKFISKQSVTMQQFVTVNRELLPTNKN